MLLERVEGGRRPIRAVTLAAMPGETEHAKGADGARRAKIWLELTTRAQVPWVNPDPVALPLLTFSWQNGSAFSFDLGGFLEGGPLQGQPLLVEAKKYASASDQNAKYDEYLAKCYAALGSEPARCANFMWFTWAAFATTSWDELLTADRVQTAVEKHKLKCLEKDDSGEPVPVDEGLCLAVAERLWLIVLSDKQEEHLVLLPQHAAMIKAAVTEEALTR